MIGHNISMINVQAGAALHRLTKDPAQAGEALGAIKASSREPLRELRATLGVLRQVDEEAPTAPAPGLARADGLVAAAKLAGLPVRIERTGAERSLPAPSPGGCPKWRLSAPRPADDRQGKTRPR